MQALAERLEGLEGRGADSTALSSMRAAVGSLRINLELLDKSVMDRIVLNERKRSHLRDVLNVHAASQSLLTPWLQITEGEIEQAQRTINDTALGADERAAAGSRLADANTSYRSLQRVQFLITSVSDRLQQISTTEDVNSVRVQEFRIQQALREARQMAAGLDARLQPLLTGRLDQFRPHVEGTGTIPELRLQELAIVAQATHQLNENTGLSRDLTEAVDRLVPAAEQDIAQATEEVLRFGRSARPSW